MPPRHARCAPRAWRRPCAARRARTWAPPAIRAPPGQVGQGQPQETGACPINRCMISDIPPESGGHLATATATAEGCTHHCQEWRATLFAAQGRTGACRPRRRLTTRSASSHRPSSRSRSCVPTPAMLLLPRRASGRGERLRRVPGENGGRGGGGGTGGGAGGGGRGISARGLHSDRAGPESPSSMRSRVKFAVCHSPQLPSFGHVPEPLGSMSAMSGWGWGGVSETHPHGGGSFPGRMEPPTAKQPVPSAHVNADGEGTLTVLTMAAETLNGEGRVQATAVLWRGQSAGHGSARATALKEAQSQLPQGWKQLWSSHQRPYYMHKKSRVCVWERPDESSGPPDPTCCICRKCYMARVQASGAAEPVSPSCSAKSSTHGSPAHDAVADKPGSHGTRGKVLQANPELHRAQRVYGQLASPPAATGSRETRPTGLAHEPGESANVYERQAASEHSGVDAVQTGHENAAPPQDDGTANSLAFPVFNQDEIGSMSAGVHHYQKSADCILAAQARSEASNGLFGVLPHVTTQAVEEVVHERRPEAAGEQNTRRGPVNRQEDAEITKNELGARHLDDASAQGQYPYPSPSTCRQEEGLECVEMVREDRGIEKRCRPARKHEDTGIDDGNDGWPWLRKRQESMSPPSHAVSGQQHPRGKIKGERETDNHVQTAPVQREWEKPLQTDNLLERLRAKWQHLTSSPERFRPLGQATRENVYINIERERERDDARNTAKRSA